MASRGVHLVDFSLKLFAPDRVLMKKGRATDQGPKGHLSKAENLGILRRCRTYPPSPFGWFGHLLAGLATLRIDFILTAAVQKLSK